MSLTSRMVLLFAVGLVLLLAASKASGQEVHVFDEALPQDGDTIQKPASPDASAHFLVIPVVTTDTAYDPNNNDLNTFDPGNPNLRADLQAQIADTNDFWLEASYDQVGVSAKVLPRYYQLPRGIDFYANPSFQDVRITGGSLAFPLAVPEGQLKVKVRYTGSDITTYTIDFAAGDSPFANMADLIDHLNAGLGTTRLDAVASVMRVRFDMENRQVRAGTYAVIDWDASDTGLLEALELDAPGVNEGTAELTGRPGSWPVATGAGSSQLTLRLLHENGTTEDFMWTIPGGANYASAAAFATAHTGDLANASITANGDRLVFDLTPAAAEPVEAILVQASSAALPLDDLGIDMPVITHGVVTESGQNTVRGDRRLIMGQAIAAFMANELTRDHGSEDIPDIAFSAANEAALHEAFNKNVDYDGAPGKPFNGYIVAILDINNKREGASGGFIDAGVKNGAYLFTHQSHGQIQIIHGDTSTGTIAHETGHNYGFPDLYNNSPGNYDPNLLYPGAWDIMGQSSLHQPGAWVKTVDSNWVLNDGGAIEEFPMPAVPGNETRRYAITPLDYSTSDYDDSLAGVPADVDAVAKVLRIPIGFDADSEHHYLLLQNRQQTAGTNAGIPQAPAEPSRGGLYLTDTITGKVFEYFTITTRNYVHPLTDKALVSGNARPIVDLAPSDDIDILGTYPAYAGIDVNIVDEIPGPGGLANKPTYIVEVSREQSDFLDLSITPWDRPPYESIDIWIEHGDKAEVDLSDVPLPGNGEPARWAADYDPAANGGKPLNWIRVKISNLGTIDATDVQLKVKVNSPGAMGDKGSWVELDLSEAKTVPAGGSTIFSIPWNPKVKGHTCILVEIFRWTAPLGEINYANQGTQENVNDFRPTAGSPWHPKPFSIDVTNPFDQKLEVYLEVEGLAQGFSVNWDTPYFVMEPRSKTTATGVMHIDENVVPTPEPDGTGGITFYRWECRIPQGDDAVPAATTVPSDPSERKRYCRKVVSKPIRHLMHVHGYAYASDFRVPIGGVSYNVMPTLRFDLDVDVGRRGGNVVVVGSTEPKAANQDMEVEVRYPSGRYEWVPVTTDDDGGFEVRFPPKEEGKVAIAVNYPDGGDFAPVKVDGQLFDPQSGGIFDRVPCLACSTQYLFWLFNFLLLFIIVVMVFIVVMRMRAR